MKPGVLCAILIAFFCAIVETRPQQFTRPEWGSQFQDIATTTTTSRPSSTTSSPEFLACMKRCPTTSEYNPVCGNNGESYHNNQRLQCAVFCGQDVAAVRLGACATN